MTDVPEVPAPLALPSPAPAGDHDASGERDASSDREAAGPGGSSRRPGRRLSVRSVLSALGRRLRKESL
ncbi:hypothetical protein ABIA35_008598 [Catenulispora sp. MAP12-49]|uniref:hypothetical protein n=1 Tax=Catenulispora sp. MAP12-49 TaxID=3156302 RepID=UPI003515E3F4